MARALILPVPPPGGGPQLHRRWRDQDQFVDIGWFEELAVGRVGGAPVFVGRERRHHLVRGDLTTGEVTLVRGGVAALHGLTDDRTAAVVSLTEPGKVAVAIVSLTSGDTRRFDVTEPHAPVHLAPDGSRALVQRSRPRLGDTLLLDDGLGRKVEVVGATALVRGIVRAPRTSMQLSPDGRRALYVAHVPVAPAEPYSCEVDYLVDLVLTEVMLDPPARVAERKIGAYRMCSFQ